MRKERRKTAVCAICGKIIDDRPTTDHIYPRSLYKWSEDKEGKLEKEIESRYNRVSAHRYCNQAKGDRLPDISGMYLSKEKTKWLRSFEKRHEKEILQYSRLKQMLWKLQGQRCYCCGCRLKQTGTLRRIDPERMRTPFNACIVCKKCNKDMAAFRQEDCQRTNIRRASVYAGYCFAVQRQNCAGR